jgi:chemotaxis protein methyltransferase CheR
MKDSRCVEFLQWSLPQLDLRWKGYRRVRRQVCRRITRRIAELGLGSVDDYQRYLAEHSGEWEILDRLCRVTISRFYRDREVFARFAAEVMPALLSLPDLEGGGVLRFWSIGCASGEEPYTLAILWHHLFRPVYPETIFEIVATERDQEMIARARAGRYTMSSLRKMPAGWLEKAFEPGEGGTYVLKQPYREYVRFEQNDVRTLSPRFRFHAVFCRNLVFTYFLPQLQERIFSTLERGIVRGGALVVGAHESLPAGASGFEPWTGHLPIYRRR